MNVLLTVAVAFGVAALIGYAVARIAMPKRDLALHAVTWLEIDLTDIVNAYTQDAVPAGMVAMDPAAAVSEAEKILRGEV